MGSNGDDFGAVSSLLHEHYDQIPVPVELEQRVNSILRAGPDPAAGQTMTGTFRPTSAGHARLLQRRRRTLLAAVAAVAVVIVGSLVLTRSIRSGPSPVGPGPASLVGVSKAAACDAPVGPFAHFFVIDREGAGEALYQGTVKVNSVAVPTSAVYVSHGALGAGYLCVSNIEGPGRSDPVRAVLAAQPRGLAYLGLIDGDQPWGAVTPGITRLTISVNGAADDVYALDSAEDHVLRPLGAGWHVFNSPGGFSGNGPVTLTITAFTGTTVSDRRTFTTGTVESSHASAPPSR